MPLLTTLARLSAYLNLARTAGCSRVEAATIQSRQPTRMNAQTDRAVANRSGDARHEIKRIVTAFEAGRDGFWLARWLRSRSIEPYAIHAGTVAA
jgi:hypothetical protein